MVYTVSPLLSGVVMSGQIERKPAIHLLQTITCCVHTWAQTLHRHYIDSVLGGVQDNVWVISDPTDLDTTHMQLTSIMSGKVQGLSVT